VLGNARLQVEELKKNEKKSSRAPAPRVVIFIITLPRFCCCDDVIINLKRTP